ncbi:MAG: VanZ family protein [Lachnospiraceae bacterium]|jgi:VanZ family protein|nr:VanZ family protein [Lachnospiraceae bacterium]
MQFVKRVISAFMSIDTSQFSLLLLAVWILVMYGHSMTPADISSEESGWVLLLTERFFEIAGIEAKWLTEYIIRKTAHFCEYCIFGMLLMYYLKHRPKRRYGHRELEMGQIYPIMLAVIFVPFVDETIQLFVAGRSAQITDVWLDMAGSCFGILLCQIPVMFGIKTRRGRRRRRRRW